MSEKRDIQSDDSPVSALLEQVQKAQGRTAKLEVVTWSLLYTLEADLRVTVIAAAVPHAFNAEALSALLPGYAHESDKLYAEVQRISFMQPFPGNMYALHDLSREAILKRLWSEDRERYHELSTRAADYFASQEGNQARIEAVYHYLIADEQRGLDEARRLISQWLVKCQYALIEALLQMVSEHAQAGRIEVSTQLWALVWQAELAYRLGDYHRAISTLRDVVDSEPTAQLEACSRALLGKTLLLTEGPETALPELEAALALYGELDNAAEEAQAMRVLGDLYWKLGQFNQARASFEKALDLYQEAQDRFGQMEATYDLGRIHRALGRYDAASELFTQALSFFQTNGYTLHQADVDLSLGDLAWSKDDQDSAQSYYEEALRLYESIGSKGGQAATHIALARLQARRGNYENVEQLYRSALKTSRIIGDKHREGEALRGSGDLSLIRGDYENARKQCEQAIGIAREAGLPILENDTRNLLGNVYVRLGEYELAKEQYEQVLAFYRQMKVSPRDQANALMGLGKCFEVSGRQREAREQYEAALDICQESGSPLGEADAKFQLANLHLAQGQLQEAQAFYSEVFAIYQQLDYRHDLAVVVAQMGSLAQLQGNTAEARRLLKESLQQFEQLGARLAVEDVCERLAQLEAARAN
jgi:tetratricopeptide (TPR) repeat protein